MRRADQHFGWYAEALVEAADHVDRERALAIQHFGNARARVDEAFEITAREALLLLAELNRIDGVGWIDRMMLEEGVRALAGWLALGR